MNPTTLNPLEILMAEHRLIERALSALEAYAWRAEAGDEVDRAALPQFVRFLRGYADELHHGKEEDLLFVRMIDAGFPSEAGPVAMMKLEHERGRALVSRLGGVGGKAAWAPEDRRVVVEAALEFVGLLRAHIQKEDRVLYPMAEQRLAEEAMARLADEFQAHLALNASRTRELEELALSLEETWVGRAASRAPVAAIASCPICGSH